MNKEYKHYKNFPTNSWHWPDFKPYEMRSKSDNRLMIDPASMDKLQALRTLLGKPMFITSAYRSPAHNKKVGGAKASKHLLAKAFDVQMRNHDPAQFEAAARQVGFTGFGFYESSAFIHIDTDRPREWGSRWFVKASGFDTLPRPDMAQMPDPIVKPNQPTGGIVSALIGFIMAIFGKGKQ